MHLSHRTIVSVHSSGQLNHHTVYPQLGKADWLSAADVSVKLAEPPYGLLALPVDAARLVQCCLFNIVWSLIAWPAALATVLEALMRLISQSTTDAAVLKYARLVLLSVFFCVPCFVEASTRVSKQKLLALLPLQV